MSSWSTSTQAAIAAAESAAAALSNKRKKTCSTPTRTAGPTYAEMSSSEFSDRVIDTPPKLTSRRSLSFAPAVCNVKRRGRDIGNDLLEELKKEVQQLNNDLASRKQETEKSHQQAATATVYVGNVDAHLARAAYTVQSFKTLLEQEQTKTTSIIEQTTLTDWAKQIEINKKRNACKT
jgi:hypothetical protein